MAVTKQTYTLNPTWTAAQHADLIRTVFIDAGLMVDWYDSFLSGSIQNRILEVSYDASKTYGRTYYWFMFTGGSMAIALATGWNSTTHVPIGSQYLDYMSTTTNATSSHRVLYSWSTTTTLTITRYQSNISPTFSWFVFRNGTSSSNFHIPNASVGSKIVSWIDLDKFMFHHYLICSLATNNTQGFIRMRQYLLLRRSYHGAAMALRDETSIDDYGVGTNVNDDSVFEVMVYSGVGNNSNAYGTNVVSGSGYSVWDAPPIFLPVGFTNTNPAFTSNSTPVFTGAQYSHYLFDSLPEDFGICMHYANNNMSLQDTLVVSSGTEEWEMINVSNNGTNGTGASPMFLARVI